MEADRINVVQQRRINVAKQRGGANGKNGIRWGSKNAIRGVPCTFRVLFMVMHQETNSPPTNELIYTGEIKKPSFSFPPLHVTYFDDAFHGT